MKRTAERDVVSRPPGVIDTLSAGYGAINRRLWVLLFPVGLDLVLLFGPHLSPTLLVGYLAGGALGPQDLTQDQMIQLSDVLARVNLLQILAMYVPSLLGTPPFMLSAPLVAHRPVLFLVPRDVLAGSVGLGIVGLLIAALYRAAIGQLVRGDPSGWLGRSLRTWGRFVLLHVAGLVLGLVVLVPWGVLVVASAAIAPALQSFFILLLQLLVLWTALYFAFSLDAMVLSRAPVVRAAFSSAAVVRGNLWSAIALLGLMLIIRSGLPIVWRALAQHPMGLVAGIVGNAYVGTGLAAASMLFYRDRLRLLRGYVVDSA